MQECIQKKVNDEIVREIVCEMVELRENFARSGISVTAVCSGWVQNIGQSDICN